MTPSVPLWVLPLLVTLVWVGRQQSRTRVVRPAVVSAVAVTMLLLSLVGVILSFGATASALLAWGVGCATAVFMGGQTLVPKGLMRVGPSVQVPGSWVPLGLMLGIFAVKFSLGLTQALAPQWLEQGWLVGLSSAALGVLSGGFAARALAVRQVARCGQTS
jgi:hypothetical protein